MKHVEFSVSPGSLVPKEKVDLYGRTLYRLQERLGRSVKSQDVVEEARHRRSPLHDYFDWDDSTAAEKYRRHQARQLLGHIQIRFLDERTGREVRERAFFNVRLESNETSSRAYVPTARVLEEEDLRSQVVDTAVGELLSWCRKYRHYPELDPIIRSVRAILAKYDNGTKDAAGTLAGAVGR